MTDLGRKLTPTLAVALAGAITAACAVLFAGSGAVLSREMSWDLMFNLAGAWNLHHGRVAHVDFHDPVGQLYFWLTRLGFWLCGPSIQAFVAGEIIAATAVFIAAAIASLPRLSPIASVIFILFASLMVLMPVNVGDDIMNFNFAMSYNVYGWAAISVLSLIVFLPRREPREGPWTDAGVGGLLMVAMYYLKVTYWAAALGELAVAFAFFPHVRRTAWMVTAGLVVANAVAPYNWPYLKDLFDVLSLPGNFTDYFEAGHIKDLLRASIAELAVYVLVGGISIGLWLVGRAPLRLLLAMGVMGVLGICLLAFNTQARGIPLAAVSLFLLYHQMNADSALRRAAPLLLVFPAWLAATATASLVAYHMAVSRTDELLVVDRTNLQGLAVPLGDVPGEGIDQDDYLETLLEAADMLKHTYNGGQGVVLFDSVNPMPFILGLPPRRGARLWLDFDFPWPRPETMFAGSNHVLIPKRPVNGDVTRKALELYGPYMTGHFPERTESRNWSLLSRAP